MAVGELAPEIDQAVNDLVSKVQVWFGQPVPVHTVPPPPGPPPSSSTHLTYLANMLLPMIGYQTYDPGAPLDQVGFDNVVAYVAFFMGQDVANLSAATEVGLGGARGYALQTAEYFAALSANSGAGAAGAAEGLARALFAQAVGDAENLYNASVNHANALYNAVMGSIQHVLGEANAHADANFWHNLAIEAQNEQEIRAQIAQAQAGLLANIQAAQAMAVNHADNLYNQSVAYTAGTKNVLEGELAAVANQAQTDAVAAAQFAVAGITTQVQTQLAPEVARVATEVDTCLAPLCDTVTPNASNLGKLGGLLKGLEAVGVAALLMGLVAAAVADPQGSAQAIVDVGGWIPSTADTLVNEVTGG